MMTNFTFKTGVLSAFLCVLAISAFGQRPAVSTGTVLPSKNMLSLKGDNPPDKEIDPSESLVPIDTVMLLDKSSSAMHFRIDPKEGLTMWRYRLLGDDPIDAAVDESLWTSGTSEDTCCIALENLDAETEYVIQFGRMNGSIPQPDVWYSMVETTRCTGPSLDQLKLIGLDYSSATMMCEMDAESYEWVLRRVGSSTARHIETTSNSIDWTNLPPNTAHESRVRFLCGGIWSDYSPADIFTTTEYEEVHCDTLSTDHVYTSDIATNYVKLNCNMAGQQFSWGLRIAGANSWTIFTTSEDHYNWTGLKAGTAYEYKVKVECQGDAWTDWSNTHYFTTKEDYNYACYPPTSGYMVVKNITYNSASTYCAMDGTEYHWAMRPYGGSAWKDYTTTNSYYHWTGLSYNTKYEYKVKVRCQSGGWTDWSSSYWFTTTDHYQNSCSTPQSHHMSVKDLTYHSAITHCAVDGYEYHWMLKENGTNYWIDFTTSNNFYSWTNLKYNTKYEYKVKVKCYGGTWTGWSSSYWFTTYDHYGSSCATPQSHHMSVKDLTYNSASTHCSIDGYGYHWMLKPYGGSQWLDYESTYNYHTWAGLNYNTKYEYKVKVKCYDGSWTGWSDSYWFTTPDHSDYGCTTPQSHHMSVKDLTYNSASTHCSVDGYEYHWMLKPYGGSTWTDYTTSNPYYNWSNLHYNTKYEYKVKVKCHNGSWTDWSDSYWFTTPNHYDDCITPGSQHMSVKNLTYSSATTYCSIDGYEYHWSLRPYGATSWVDYTTSDNYHQWDGLYYNTKYEYKVKVKCHNGSWTGWSGIYWFNTPDHYGGCDTPGSEHMSVKNVTYSSATTHCSMDGYEYHWALRKWGTYGWTDYTSHYNYYDWTDLYYNTKYEYRVKVKCHDGSWTDWSDVYWFSTYDHYNNCTTPESHHMSADNITYNTATTHCGVSGVEYHWMMRPYGGSTWEDHVTSNNYYNWSNLNYNTKYEYKVKVKCSSSTWTSWSSSYWFTTHDHYGYGCSAPAGYDFTIYQQEYNLFRIYLYTPFTKWSSQIRKAGSYEWTQHTTTVNNMAWGNLESNTEYEYRVNRTCADGSTSDWSAIRSFWTGSSSVGLNSKELTGPDLNTETPTQATETTELLIFPNPASQVINLVGVNPGQQIIIVDMHGKMVLQQIVEDGNDVNIEALDNGIYEVLTYGENGNLKSHRLSILK